EKQFFSPLAPCHGLIKTLPSAGARAENFWRNNIIMNSSLGLKSLRSLALMSLVAVMAPVLILRAASPQDAGSSPSKDPINSKSGKRKEKEQEKKKDKSKTDGEGDVSRAPVITSAAADVASMETVTATVETDPIPNGGDAADDPAIWVNPQDPAQST